MNNIKDALNKLLTKYDIKSDSSLNLLPGWFFVNKELTEKDIPLLSWRYNRKFIELQKITGNNIVEHVCMLRFCCLVAKDAGSLITLMYREFDLCEFIGQGKISSLHATFTDNSAGNVIVKLDNGIICSVEIGNQMPAGSKMVDRHEVIARRGVASDLVVDTQIPQSSVYTFTKTGESRYKDVDDELFGHDELGIEQIRSAFEFLKNTQLKPEYIRQHNHLSLLVNAAFNSDKKCKKIEIKEGGTIK